jgi:hypothetical protein
MMIFVSFGQTISRLNCAYLNGQSQFIPHLLPELAVKIPTAQIAYLLERKLGQATFYQAINPTIP